MKGKTRFSFKELCCSLIIFTLLSACGGGGGGSSSSSTPSNAMESGVISGSAVKGSVSGATVIAYAINADGTPGGMIGSTQTDANGNFSMSVSRHSGPVMLQMNGGSYLDEATGLQMSMGSKDIMTCAIPSMSGATVSGFQITPLTSMAQSMAQNMSGGMNQMNITLAYNAVGNYFDVSDILTTHPIDLTVNGSGVSATQDMGNYGMTMAVMSQYARNIGMPHSSGMVTAMMNDASDGRMNGMMTVQGGMMGNFQIEMGGGIMGGTMMPADAGTRGLADAMAQFINSPMNKSGLSAQDMQGLISKLATSNGQLQ